MKKVILLYFGFAVLTLNCSNTASKNKITPLNTQEKEVLQGIQGKIFNAFVQSNIQHDPAPLIVIQEQLKGLAAKKQNRLLTYWQAYLQYYAAIFYLSQENKEKAEAEIDIAVDLMDDLGDKNSEDYALLALVESFSIQFKGLKAMFISGSIKKNGKRAISLDPKNCRAYYVLASNDFYTPEQYGGGEQAEELLVKALSLPAQQQQNPYLPSWGKEESYELLVKHYVKSDQRDKAKRYCKEGLELFPNSYGLGKLAISLLE
ncbi:MAG: hypothetical protein AAGF96_01585 [Bacteroidota bacterium]